MFVTLYDERGFIQTICDVNFAIVPFFTGTEWNKRLMKSSKGKNKIKVQLHMCFKFKATTLQYTIAIN